MTIGRIPSVEGGIQPTIVDAKGDLIVATAADTVNRLAVGTNEYRLVADSGQTTGLKYVADTTNYAVAAKGDLLVGTAADTVAALTVGSANQVLTVDSSTATGLKWAAPAAGGWTELATANLPTNTNTVTISNLSTDYRMLVVMMRDFYATDNDYLLIRFNGNSNQDYGQIAWYHSAENTVSNNANGINNAIEPNLDSFLNAQRDNFFYLQIPDYSNATTHKSGTFNGKARNAGDTYNMNLSGTFQFASTSAITSVTLATNSSNWAGGSYIIYGVK